MSAIGKTIQDVGEKALIRSLIKPLLNPTENPDLVGDDCAVLSVNSKSTICLSTDRVPADLISFRLGIIDHYGLGYYLAVLNLSDIAAMGAEPSGLLLNLGLPGDMKVVELEKVIKGAAQACREYGCQIIGGDLSSAVELSLSATSVGTADYDKLLRRTGARLGDQIYCTGDLGLTSTAFFYFLDAKRKGMRLDDASEQLLKDQFQRPTVKFHLARLLSELTGPVTCMDCTDGAGQTILEICEQNKAGAFLHTSSMPVHDVSREVAAYLEKDVFDIVLGPGADFSLIGTFPSDEYRKIAGEPDIHVIGEITAAEGIILKGGGCQRELVVAGWDYYMPSMVEMVEKDL